MVAAARVFLERIQHTSPVPSSAEPDRRADLPVLAIGGFAGIDSNAAVGSVFLVWRVREPMISSLDLEPLQVLGAALVSTLDRVHAERAVRDSEERFRRSRSRRPTSSSSTGRTASCGT